MWKLIASIVVASIAIATIFFASSLTDEELAHLRKAIDRSYSRRAVQTLRASPDAAVKVLHDDRETDATTLLATSSELVGPS